MATLPKDVDADLRRRIFELEQRLDVTLAQLDQAIERQAATALVNFRLQNELRASLERQNASADILRTIAAAPTDAEQVLQRIAGTTARFFNAAGVTIRIAEGDEWVKTIRVGAASQRTGAHPAAPSVQRGKNLPGTVYQENRQIHIPDLDTIDPSMADWPAMAARAEGIRTICGTPLRREGKAIGALVVYRNHLAPFTAEELALQQAFADQAVIAIENARLFNETKEALERQTATTAILSIISNAAGNLAPVFDSILEKAHRLCGAPCGSLQLYENDRVVPVAIRGMTPQFAEFLRRGYAFTEGTRDDLLADHPLQIVDVAGELRKRSDAAPLRAAVELGGIGTMATVPLLKNGVTFGRIVAARQEVRPFEDKQIALLEGFAAQAVIAIENARLFNETKEALERQTATADILRVIASSPSDVQPVFEAIAESARRVVGGFSSLVTRIVSDDLHVAAFTSGSELGKETLARLFPQPLSSPRTLARVARTGQILVYTDTESESDDTSREIARARGYRSLLAVPMLRDGVAIGTISVTRTEPGGFDDNAIGLLKTFADQAVIAIENVRLFNETREALERQTATSDILRVIASSPADVQPVFNVIVERAVRLCGARMGRVYRYDGKLIHMVGGHGLSEPGRDSAQRPFPRPASDDTIVGRVMLSRRPNILADVNQDDSVPPLSQQMISAIGARSQVTMPMLLKGEPIGAITLSWTEPRGYNDQQIALLQTFADQAVIAIENVRLFNETREALERQTATAEILKVIASSPSDVQPVFDAIATSANRLLGGFSSTVILFIDGAAHLKAFTATTPLADELLKSRFPRPIAEFPPAQMAQLGEITQIADTEAAPDDMRDIARARGFRSVIFTPLRNKDVLIGVIAVTRVQSGEFADHHVQLLQTFANQAVIAIENVRLFNETREALERQTATADILKVIASSPADVQPVFEAIVNSAATLFQPCAAAITTLRDGKLHFNAIAQLVPSFDHERVKAAYPLPADPDRSPSARAILERRIIEISDIEAPDTPEFTRKAAAAGGFRHVIFVPLVHQDVGIGTIILNHPLAGFKLSGKQLALLQTFADQAVIAIENTRLFNETREALERQTATADVLKVIASSPSDTQPVFDAIAASANRLLSGFSSTVFLFIDGMAHLGAFTHTTPEADEILRSTFPRPVTEFAPMQMTQGGEVVQIPDTEALTDAIKDVARARGYRSMLFAPLMNKSASIGFIAVTRIQTGAFVDHHVELLKTFADQAVIAIENARLFDEVQARTRDLAKSLDDLRTAQDRLIQTEKLASLGQLTAGIAHEIKNPLNFVNNFALLSAELTDELKDVLKPAALDVTIRSEVDELTGTLKDNLGKVVQHGKRADSIVKNMLLHSREGSGEHRPADVNALVDESLNLAYHGARAEKPQFNVTLQRDFDPDAGSADVFPQDITRVLLNLISNGFYAVTKRKANDGGANFEPTVRATTLSRGDHVEIRIRDNGTGIPEQVKEKMFNPFFTTKPAGEGTGLGLSMSHDIIVKQHGGTIEVETEPGAFTEFRVVLPRASVQVDTKAKAGN